MRRTAVTRSRIVLAFLATALTFCGNSHAARVGDEARWTKPGEHCVDPVVAGGVHSQPELLRAKAGDQAVQAHYADFNDQAAVARVLSGPVEGYVSYRKSGRIFWTADRIRIPAGETVLDDGVTLIWCKCGRRVSTERAAISPGQEDTANGTLALPRYRARGGPLLLLPLRPATNAPTQAPTGEPVPLAPLPEGLAEPVYTSAIWVYQPTPVSAGAPAVAFTPPPASPADLPNAPYYPTTRPSETGYLSGNVGMVASESRSIAETLPYVAFWPTSEPVSGSPSLVLWTGPTAVTGQLTGPVLLETTSVPEPGSAALMLAGVTLLLGCLVRFR